MEKLIKVNKKELEVLKKALDRHKEFLQYGIGALQRKGREELINELYNLESVENKVKRSREA
jgi:hypothetical protein